MGQAKVAFLIDGLSAFSYTKVQAVTLSCISSFRPNLK